jgi:hypothetical protein
MALEIHCFKTCSLQNTVILHVNIFVQFHEVIILPIKWNRNPCKTVMLLAGAPFQKEREINFAASPLT